VGGVGNIVKRKRELKGITLTELARRCGISKGYLSQIERGESGNPTGSVLYNVARELDTTMEVLLGRQSLCAVCRERGKHARCQCGCCHIPDHGACQTFERGSNMRCVYCDHGEDCHPGRGAWHNGPLWPAQNAEAEEEGVA